MFKYNRRNNLYVNTYTNNKLSSINRQRSTILQRTSLKNSINDINIFKTQQMQKMKNINILNNIQKKQAIEVLSQLGNARRLAAKQENINNSETITRFNSALPKPRSYQNIKKETIVVSDQKQISKILNKINQNQINQFKQHDPLSQKPVQVINQTSALVNLINIIDNNQNSINNLNIENNILQKQSQVKESNIQKEQSLNIQETKQKQKDNNQQQQKKQNQLKYVISMQQLLNKAQYIAQTLQTQIYANPQYNYYKLIQFVHNMYQQYGNNNMVLMIICKGFSQFNKKQLIKLPEDKIGDIIQYIITQIKKCK